MKSQSKGFTLIELLVVIAIIGILAALVLVALGSARDKANDARVKSGMGQLRTLAEVIYDTNSASYGVGGDLGINVEDCFGGIPSVTNCGDTNTSTNVTTLIADIDDANGNAAFSTVPNAESTGGAFCVEAVLTDGATYICVDSTGVTTSGTSSTCDTANANCS